MVLLLEVVHAIVIIISTAMLDRALLYHSMVQLRLAETTMVCCRALVLAQTSSQ